MPRRPARQPGPGSLIHIGERALADLRKQYLASHRKSVRPKRAVSGGATVEGIGGNLTVGPPVSPTDLSKYDDAKHVRAYLGDSLVELSHTTDVGVDSEMRYLAGVGHFNAIFVRTEASDLVQQIAYVAKIRASREGEPATGLLFLLGSYRNSMWSSTSAQMTAWTPSSPEGLRYAFHIRRGAPPEDFNPVAGYRLPRDELGHLADDVLVIATGALSDPHAVFDASFVAQIHGCFYAGDETGQHYPAVPLLRAPAFCLFGAALVLAAD